MASSTLPSMFSLTGQTALVTGGTRGIGQAMTLALAEAGADILLVQRNTTHTETKTAVEKLHRKAGIYEADLSSEESVAALVPAVLHDGHRIDILVNCAGVQRRHPSHQFPSQEWNEVDVYPLTSFLARLNHIYRSSKSI